MNETDELDCAACHSKQYEMLENVDVDYQHNLYVKGNDQVAEKLTNLLSLGRDNYQMLKCQSCGLEYANPLLCPGGPWYSLLYANTPLYPERWNSIL